MNMKFAGIGRERKWKCTFSRNGMGMEMQWLSGNGTGMEISGLAGTGWEWN